MIFWRVHLSCTVLGAEALSSGGEMDQPCGNHSADTRPNISAVPPVYRAYEALAASKTRFLDSRIWNLGCNMIQALVSPTKCWHSDWCSEQYIHLTDAAGVMRRTLTTHEKQSKTNVHQSRPEGNLGDPDFSGAFRKGPLPGNLLRSPRPSAGKQAKRGHATVCRGCSQRTTTMAGGWRAARN
jgi:hypothetical protein